MSQTAAMIASMPRWREMTDDELSAIAASDERVPVGWVWEALRRLWLDAHPVGGLRLGEETSPVQDEHTSEQAQRRADTRTDGLAGPGWDPIDAAIRRLGVLTAAAETLRVQTGQLLEGLPPGPWKWQTLTPAASRLDPQPRPIGSGLVDRDGHFIIFAEGGYARVDVDEAVKAAVESLPELLGRLAALAGLAGPTARGGGDSPRRIAAIEGDDLAAMSTRTLMDTTAHSIRAGVLPADSDVAELARRVHALIGRAGQSLSQDAPADHLRDLSDQQLVDDLAEKMSRGQRLSWAEGRELLHRLGQLTAPDRPSDAGGWVAMADSELVRALQEARRRGEWPDAGVQELIGRFDALRRADPGGMGT